MKLLVMPSYYEGLPATVLEAMACGTPVLATGVGAIPDIVKEGETGFIIGDLSPERLADDIVRALGHPELPLISRNGAALIDRERPEQIYHLAGQSSVAVSFDRPAETFESIASSTLHLLEAVRTATVPPRLFVAGSSEIFGTQQTAPVTCSSPLHPQNPYAVAKTTAFRIVQQYRHEHGLFACTGVLFNHESPLRPARFVTQKIVAGVCEIAAGRQQELYLPIH